MSNYRCLDLLQKMVGDEPCEVLPDRMRAEATDLGCGTARLQDLTDLDFPDFFYKILDYEFARAERYKNIVSLIFIKFNLLREISANYGKGTAGRILKDLERLICDNIRRSDRGFIYGKDEFMIILPNTPKDGAFHIVPKLKRLIEHYSMTNEEGRRFKLSPRFGVASYPHDIQTVNDAARTA